MVLIDTPIWSLALRRKEADLSAKDRNLVRALGELIQDSRAQIVGPIRQELLSGIREPAHYRKIRDRLRDFSEPSLEIADYEEAARICNQCRSCGFAGSSVDFLLCAIAHRKRWQIFTIDRDFENYSHCIPLRLYSV